MRRVILQVRSSLGFITLTPYHNVILLITGTELISIVVAYFCFYKTELNKSVIKIIDLTIKVA
jgi:hypothetical protein